MDIDTKRNIKQIIASVVGILAIVALLLVRLRKLLKQKEEPKKLTVEELIRIIAKEEQVDPDLAVRVAKCESSLQPFAIRKNTDGSVDRGLYQWNSKWHPEITDQCAFNPDCATRQFCKAVKENHLDWWKSSKNCWKVK